MQKIKKLFTIHYSPRSSKGFTLIELLVVIAIIGLLASIVVVALQGPRQTARDTKRQGDIRNLQTAMELCYGDSACNAAESYMAATDYDEAKINGIGIYIVPSNMPDDPKSGSVYTWVSTASTFCVYANLEGEDYVYASEKGYGKRSAAGCP